MVRTFLLMLLLGASGTAYAQECKIAENAIKEASSIRGLAIRKKVPCLLHNKDQVKKYLMDSVAEKIPPERLAAEEAIYKALGMIPEDFRYKEGLIELYLSQIGGYYDPEKKQYIMAAWLPDMLQPGIAVHELTHALQDQHFNLGPMMDLKQASSDELLARSALVEGDASLVMFDYQRKLVGGQPLAEQDNINAEIVQSLMSANMVAGNGAPESLISLMIFPYTSGMRFTHELLKKDGYRAISAAFKRLPRSSEEILHPEKYLSGKQDFVELNRADAGTAAGKDVDPEFEDRLGEFTIIALFKALKQTAPEFTEAANGWGGDIVALYPKDGGRQRVVWLLNWDTEKDAKEFEIALKKAVGGDWNKVTGKRSMSFNREGLRTAVLVDLVASAN